MLRQLAENVFIRTSEWMATNTVIVTSGAGALIVDPGIHESELIALAGELTEPVVAGFATHPHWDHLLWHASLGTPPRYATAAAERFARERLSGGIDAKRLGIPDDVSLDLLGAVTPVPDGAEQVPWSGPPVRIVEHSAHAPGHAALLVEGGRVLVAGDMLSDVFIPMLNLVSGDPISDYLAALDLLEGVAAEVDVVVPGHGSIGGTDDVLARIAQDRAYVQALRDGVEPEDSRIGADAKPGWEFVRDVHERQVAQLRS